ncbi:MAG: Fic family protein [Thermoplasmata archaeon]|nr:MAG: Fic family protein [Thermoplasmata archaeon]
MKIPTNPPDLEKIRKKYNGEKILEYLERDDVKKFIEHINKKYLYWDELKHRPVPKRTQEDILWLLVKLFRQYNAKVIQVSKVKNFTFTYNITDWTQEKLHEFDLNLAGSLESNTLIPSGDREKYLVSSIMEEAIASSQLEGAATTRDVAKKMLRTSRKPVDKNERMILNNYITIKKIIELKDEKLTHQMILDIHASITKGTLDDDKLEGKFRDTNDVYVIDPSTGETYYEPPDNKLIDQLIIDFCDFANEKTKIEFIHPIVKAIILHFLMGYIHPFVDGNGRTARAIFYWYLISKGYWLFEFTSISRTIVKSPSKYKKAYLFTERDNNDLTYFINYQIKTIDTALKDLKNYIAEQIKEKEDLFEVLKLEGINDRQIYLIKKFIENPKKTYTIYEVRNIFNVVYQTARTDLLDLEKSGFVTKKKIGKKKYLFFKSESFDNKINKLSKK